MFHQFICSHIYISFIRCDDGLKWVQRFLQWESSVFAWKRIWERRFTAHLEPKNPPKTAVEMFCQAAFKIIIKKKPVKKQTVSQAASLKLKPHVRLTVQQIPALSCQEAWSLREKTRYNGGAVQNSSVTRSRGWNHHLGAESFLYLTSLLNSARVLSSQSN